MLSMMDLRVRTDEWLQVRRVLSPSNHIADADGLLTEWLRAESRWRIEHDEAVKILNPYRPDLSLVEACREATRELDRMKRTTERLERLLDGAIERVEHAIRVYEGREVAKVPIP